MQSVVLMCVQYVKSKYLQIHLPSMVCHLLGCFLCKSAMPSEEFAMKLTEAVTHLEDAGLTACCNNVLKNHTK